MGEKKACSKCTLPHSVDFFRIRRHVHGKVRWQLIASTKGKVARLEHAGGASADDRLSQNMKVADHGIGFPMPQKLDDIGINIGTEEGGGPTSSQGPGTDFVWDNVELNSVGECQMDPRPQHGGHVLGSDINGLGRVPEIIKISTQWGIRWCIAEPKVNYVVYHSAHGTHNIVACHPMGDDFAFHPILLSCEREQDVSRAVKLMDGRCRDTS